MNYRHAYHAGSFSDVFKHIFLMGLLQALLRKDKPFCYLETHAGAGRYPLRGGLAEKTGEFKEGIESLMAVSVSEGHSGTYIPVFDDLPSLESTPLLPIRKPFPQMPALVSDYLSCVQQAGYPAFYPGSPCIAQALVRSCDRLALCELDPPVYRLLKRHLHNTLMTQVHVPENTAMTQVHAQDGFLALKALLPPKERRGLILVDPPFEDPKDWTRLIEGLENSLKKFPQGVYAVWFPIKDLKAVALWIRKIQQLALKDAWVFEWMHSHPKDLYWGLPGCGMLIVNMPFQLQTVLGDALAYLCKTIGQKDSAYRFYALNV